LLVNLFKQIKQPTSSVMQVIPTFVSLVLNLDAKVINFEFRSTNMVYCLQDLCRVSTFRNDNMD